MHFLGAVTKTRPMMIMTEFMPGGSLTDLLYGGGEARFSIWRAVQMALDMARALEYMHNRSPQVRSVGLGGHRWRGGTGGGGAVVEGGGGHSRRAG